MALPRIRKGEHELSHEDFAQFPFWEYALDEEREPDQDETTMRPRQVGGLVDRGAAYGLLGARFRLADTREFPGVLTIGSGFDGPCHIQTMRPTLWCESRRVSLSLPLEKAQSDEVARENVRAIYQLLDCTVESMFPVTIRPALRIKGMDPELRVDGFMQPAVHGRVELIM